MARKGSFRRMFDGLIQVMGRDPGSRHMILFSETTGDYMLIEERDAASYTSLKVEEDFRIVMRPTFNEMREILKRRQLELMFEEKHGDSSKDLPSG